MTTELSEYPPVRISLKKSSSKDGQEGWDIDVTSDATDLDMGLAVNHALKARQLLRSALGLEENTGYVEKLEASVAALAAEGGA